MTRVLTRSAILTEMERVADRLAAGKIVGPERLALLRRQAELGDLRDALAHQARHRSG